jgi:hypothetical protein
MHGALPARLRSKGAELFERTNTDELMKGWCTMRGLLPMG